MIPSISQKEYSGYARFLAEIKVVEQCCRKGEISRIDFREERFRKLGKIQSHQNTINPPENLFNELPQDHLEKLKERIVFVSQMHSKFNQIELDNRNSDDCAPLIAECHNQFFKTISSWNTFVKEEWRIHFLSRIDPLFSEKTTLQIADEEALTRYFELLEQYPQLKRLEWNDYKKGVYQILYDKEELLKVRQEAYQRFYKKAKKDGLTDSQAIKRATNESRIGVVFEDSYWLVIRDAVISPQNHKHTYNRLFSKPLLTPGAAVLPLIEENGEKKLVLLLIFRHATNSWELEIPRGGAKLDESPADTAKRETLEETGYAINPVLLGTVTPDSGLTSSIIPIFLGKVTKEEDSKLDASEAIKTKRAFTIAEIKDGIGRGYIEIEIDEHLIQVPIRDAFTLSAFSFALCKELL